MPGGSNLRQCTHCLEKMNCANRRCTKCGKLLDMKCRQTARMKVFRTRAKEWAQKVKKSRNQAKTFDNSALLVEKLKALGYFPLLLWGKYRPQNKKWTVQLQCPFELPVVAHAVLEKIVCLFEGLLEACGPEREEVGQQERTGEEDEAEEEIDEEGQRGQGEQCKIGETGRRDMEEIEIEAQEDRVESERVEKGEMEGQEELEGMETEEEVGQQKRTGEEDEAEEEMDEDQRGQGEQCKIGETGRRDMEEIEIEAQEDRVESERLEKGEMEGQEEVGGMETEEMEADKEKEQTEEVGKIEIEVKKKVVAASRKSAVKISAKKKRIKRRQNKDDACQCHSTLDIFPVQYVSKTREKKGRKEVLVHWLPCPSCQKAWPPSWEPQENIEMTVS